MTDAASQPSRALLDGIPHPEDLHPIGVRGVFAACATFLAVFVVALRAAPSTIVAGGDAFRIAADHILSFQTLTGNVFATHLSHFAQVFLPLGNAAFRVHILAGVLAGMAAGVFALYLIRIFKSPTIAIAGAVFVGWGPVFLREATADVRWSLSLLGIAVVLHGALGFIHQRSLRALMLLSGGVGLLFGMERGAFIAVLPLVVCHGLPVWLALKGRGQGKSARWTAIGTLAVLLLMVKVTFALRAVVTGALPEFSLVSLALLLFGNAGQLTAPFEAGAPGIADALLVFGQSFLWIGILVGVVGAWFAWQRRWLFTLGLLSMVIVSLGLSLVGGATHGLAVLLPGLLAWGFFISAALAEARVRLVGKPRLVRMLPAAGALLSAVAVMAIEMSSSYRAHHHLAYDYGRNLLHTPWPTGTLFVTDDALLPTIAYHQIIEGRRPDVAVIDRQGRLFEDIYDWPFPGDFDGDREARINAREDAYMAETAGHFYFTSTRGIEGIYGWAERPFGLLSKIIPVASPASPPPDRWRLYTMRGLDNDLIARSDPTTAALADRYLNRQAAGLHAEGFGPEVGEALETMAEQGENLPEVHYNSAVLLLARGNVDESIAAFRRAIAEKPDFNQAYLQLGVVYEQTRRWSEAAQLYREALQQLPENGLLHLRLGKAYETLRNLDGAEQHYREAVRLLPNEVDAHNNLGVLLGQKQEFAESVRHLQRALALDRDSTKVRNNLGVILTQMGQYQSAESELRKVVEADPDYAEARSNLADAILLQGRAEEAVQEYRRALEINPKLTQVRYNLGYALIYNLNRQQEGVAEWQQFLREMPNHPQAAQIRAELNNLTGQ